MSEKRIGTRFEAYRTGRIKNWFTALGSTVETVPTAPGVGRTRQPRLGAAGRPLVAAWIHQEISDLEILFAGPCADRAAGPL
jgi:hypothetical protein